MVRCNARAEYLMDRAQMRGFVSQCGILGDGLEPAVVENHFELLARQVSKPIITGHGNLSHAAEDGDSMKVKAINASDFGALLLCYALERAQHKHQHAIRKLCQI